MRKKLQLCGLLVFFIFIVAPFVAQADERALHFDVTAKVLEDGSMVVRERIHVHIKQMIIRHGITHAFPIKERYGDKNIRHYGFEVLQVTLDGQPINYYSSTAGLMTSMAIGQKGVPAPLGDHVYEIIYKTTGHVRFLPERDEIYYNVVGNFWQFPVDKVSFTLILPDEKQDAFLETTAFTGKSGESGNDYILDGQHTVITTRTLEPGEGLTVAMAWEKGLVQEPKETWANLLGTQRTPILLGILLIISGYVLGQRYLCKRSAQGVVVPIFSAPEGMSPGYMAVLKHMEYSGPMLQADIVWSAVKGFLHLNATEEHKILLQKKEPANSGQKTPPPWIQEHLLALRDHLFPKGYDQIDLKDEEGQEIAMHAFEYLQEQYQEQQKGFWKSSYLPGVFGLILFFGLFFWALHYIYTPMVDPESVHGEPLVFLAIQTGIVGLIGLFLFAIRKSWLDFDGIRAWLQTGLAILAICGLSYVALVILCPDPFFLIVFAGSFALVAWLTAFPPTIIFSKGRQAYLHMRGLEMYIRTAETDRLAKLNAPEDTVEKFEELLPYAIALDCAQAWQKRFGKILTDADYTPSWLTTTATFNMTYAHRLNYVTGVSGLQAATMACAKASHAQKQSSNDDGGGSGFGGRGSSGGGSGGSSVGGW